MQGLEKSFRSPQGMVHAVRGIDISIERGETVALLGPNGAGKTTTIDMLLGLTTPDAGSVSLFGRPPSEAIMDGAIGAMLQTGQLIRDLSVRELLSMMAGLYPNPLPVEEVLKLVGIKPIAERRTQKLSGGETQRARFAVALVCDPDLLVLDEPTVAMDVEGRRDGRAPHDPSDAPGRRPRRLRAPARRQLGRAARRRDRPALRRLRRHHPRAAAGLSARPRHRDRRRRARAGLPPLDRRR
jgi:ABC-type lipoprotein export system ATPase subunit